MSITALIASATNLEQLNELIEATTIELNPSVIDQLNQPSNFMGVPQLPFKTGSSRMA